MTTSTIAKSLARLRSSAAEIASQDFGYPVDSPSFDSPISDAELESLDPQILAAMPADLLEFWRACGGISAMDLHNGYRLLGPTQAVQIRRDGPTHVNVDGTLHASVPIAADGGGNLFLLELGPPFRVWRSDHERITGPVVGESAVTEVARGFSEFLERVATDWEHFADGDQNWRFCI